MMRVCLLLAALALPGPARAAGPAVGELDRVPEPQGPRVRPALAAKYEIRDPAADDWQGERASQELAAPLGRIEALLETPSEITGEAVAALAAPGFVGAPLRPLPLEVVFRSGPVTVRRPAVERPGEPLRGGAGLRAALAALAGPLAAAGEARVALKLFRIDVGPRGAETRIHYGGSAFSPGGSLQQGATWRALWVPAAEGGPPWRLAALSAEGYEEVAVRVPGGTLFADVTGSALGANPSFREELLPGLHRWWGVLDRTSGIGFRGYHGLAVGDADGDGLDDLFVAQPGGLPDKLFLQDGDGTARDASAEAGIDYLEVTRSALFVDLDGDGDQDLATVKAAHVVILENGGPARFRPAALLPLPGGVGLAAADYDGDGDLDLYGYAYRHPDEGLPPTPYHDADNGEPNRLYRNDGGFRFTEVTEEVGLDENNRRFSFAAAWEDYDNDGDQDLYVANDFGRNNLYRNDGGRFRDAAVAAGVEDISAGMGVTWADVDGDGWMDLYVSNMFSAAGGRVAYQRRFQEGAPEETRSLYRRHARGNSLFRNDGDGTFTDVSEGAGVTMGRWAWGSLFLDMDNDGLVDIAVPNGYLTNEAADDL